MTEALQKLSFHAGRSLFFLALVLTISPVGIAAEINNDVLIDQLMEGQTGAPDAAAKRIALQKEMAVQDLVIKESEKLGFTKTPAFMARMELAKRSLTTDAYWRGFFEKHPIDEAAVKSAYDRIKASNGDKQYRLHMLFVKDEATGKLALNALRKDESFGAVAAKYSLDVATRERGGDLGWQWKSNLVAPASEALASMKMGDIRGVQIVSPEGIMVLKLDEVRDQPFPGIDALRQQLVQALRQSALQEELRRLQAAK
jgi:peptidyl-prolyl cis-trans isomerase C